MGLMGVASLAELTADMVEWDDSIGPPSGDWLEAAFPLLEQFTGNF